jgi:hypothetical protein
MIVVFLLDVHKVCGPSISLIASLTQEHSCVFVTTGNDSLYHY